MPGGCQGRVPGVSASRVPSWVPVLHHGRVPGWGAGKVLCRVPGGRHGRVPGEGAEKVRSRVQVDGRETDRVPAGGAPGRAGRRPRGERRGRPGGGGAPHRLSVSPAT